MSALNKASASVHNMSKQPIATVAAVALDPTFSLTFSDQQTRLPLIPLSTVSRTLKFRRLIFAPLVSPLPAQRLAEATYPGDHEKVGAGQPTDWVALPGKGNDSPWLGPTFIEEETTYLTFGKK